MKQYGIEDIKSLDFREGVRDHLVYKHTCKITNKVYIGQTNNSSVRWKPTAYKNCIKFYNAIQKYGWDNLSQAATALNISVGNISSAIHGVRKTAGGYIWKVS